MGFRQHPCILYSVSGLDPFGAGWTMRKPKLKKEIEKGVTTTLNQVGSEVSEGQTKQHGNSADGPLSGDYVHNAGSSDRQKVVTNQIREESDKPVVEVSGHIVAHFMRDLYNNLRISSNETIVWSVTQAYFTFQSGPVTSQVKATSDAVVGPVTVQV